jgi:uncharacterized membrane protein
MHLVKRNHNIILIRVFRAFVNNNKMSSLKKAFIMKELRSFPDLSESARGVDGFEARDSKQSLSCERSLQLQGRLLSIDVLRTLSILLMIQVHFKDYMARYFVDVPSLYASRFSVIFGRMPAPVFSFLVGLSLFLWMQKKKTSGWSEDKIIKAAVRRGLFLFMVGLVFLVVVWLPDWIFIWDILTFLGAATVILIPIRNWSTGRLVLLALAFLLITPHLLPITGYGTYWHGGEYNPDFTLRGVVLGFLLHGYFPILPWLVFPVMGFATGKEFVSFAMENSKENWRMLAIGFGFGWLSFVVYFFRSDASSFFDVYTSRAFTIFPASTYYVTTMVAISCLGFWILNRWLDKGSTDSRGLIRSFFRRYSSFSLTTYVIHQIAFVPVMHIFAAYQGKENLRYYYNRVVSAPVALLLAALFVFVFYGTLVMWEKKRRYSIEGLLRWFSES